MLRSAGILSSTIWPIDFLFLVSTCFPIATIDFYDARTKSHFFLFLKFFLLLYYQSHPFILISSHFFVGLRSGRHALNVGFLKEALDELLPCFPELLSLLGMILLCCF